MKRQLFFVSLLMLLMSCASSRRMPVGYEEKLSGGERPSWVDNLEKHTDDEVIAFVGISDREASEPESRNVALQYARGQIIDAMGMYGKRKFQKVVSTVGVASDIIDPAIVRDEMSNMVSENIVKAYASRFHTEKWLRYTEIGTEIYYKAYVLVLFPRSQEKELSKLVLENVAKTIKDEKDRRNIERALKKSEEIND